MNARETYCRNFSQYPVRRWVSFCFVFFPSQQFFSASNLLDFQHYSQILHVCQQLACFLLDCGKRRLFQMENQPLKYLVKSNKRQNNKATNKFHSCPSLFFLLFYFVLSCIIMTLWKVLWTFLRNQFKYLDTLILSNGCNNTEIASRIVQAKKKRVSREWKHY